MKLKTMVGSLALLGLASHALAQDAAPQRIEITGSSIKRIQSEGALPVQVIRADDLARAGITSAEQLLSIISANGNGINNLATNQGGDFLNSLSGRSHNNGASNASLRGLGEQYTLVLLNGRRVSTHGLSGQSVDLNSIPMAAVDRIEVLKDGASAIYGTDAIGGVINFILKRDYRGMEVTALIDVTQGGGGGIFSGSTVFGAGNLETDRYNFVASLTLDKQDRLRGSQRDFQNGVQPSRGLVPDTTGTPYANIGVAGGTALAGSFKLPGDATSYNRISTLAVAGNCGSVTDMGPYRGDLTGFANSSKACSYDYGRQWSLLQPVEHVNLVGRGNFKLGADHTAFIEFVGSNVKSAVEYTPIQITNTNVAATSPYYQNLATLLPTLFKPTNTNAADLRVFFDASKPERVRWRCIACGPRQQETTTNAFRTLVGMEGLLSGWDYKLGLSSATSKANTVLGDGNMYTAALAAAMATGLINPFLLNGQSQTPAALALINGAKATGASLYGGEAGLKQFDATISRDLMMLPAGPLGFALGLDLRREKFVFNNTQQFSPPITGVGSPASLNEASRSVKALFTEFAVPIFKGLDMQLAARYDRYSDFGSTTNPKVALRWVPFESLLLRGSFSRGFHAPDFDALYGGTAINQFNSDINDPLLCPGGKPTDAAGTGCAIRPEIDTTSNPNLKAERSKQMSFGFVVSPVPWFSASVDFWRIDLTDRISALSGQLLIARYDQYKSFVVRDPVTNEIIKVVAPILNLAGDRTSGADINLTSNFTTGFGKIKATLDGTYVSSYKNRFSDADPWQELVGSFGDTTYGFNLHLRWKHAINVNWSQGAWAANFTQNYSSGYRDEVDGYGSGVILQNLGFQSKVASYTTYNASATYTGEKNLTLTWGVKNVFNTAPPFTLHNVDNVAGAGWDARVGDARGRAFTFSVNYKFF